MCSMDHNLVKAITICLYRYSSVHTTSYIGKTYIRKRRQRPVPRSTACFKPQQRQQNRADVELNNVVDVITSHTQFEVLNNNI